MYKLTDLQILLQLYPKEEWSYNELSVNNSINWNIIQRYPKKPWNYHQVSENKNITFEIVRKHPIKLASFIFYSYNSILGNSISFFCVFDRNAKKSLLSIIYLADVTFLSNMLYIYFKSNSFLEFNQRFMFIVVTVVKFSILFEMCRDD